MRQIDRRAGRRKGVLVSAWVYTDGMASREHATRAEQKLRTRRALLDSALRLLEEQAIDGLALREVAREAGLSPTGFYRHFPDIEALGIALVEDSFSTLRGMLRSARTEASGYGDVMQQTVTILHEEVRRNRAHFRFIARERFSGMAGVRRAIRTEIRLFESELAVDLSQLPGLDSLEAVDLRLFASVLVALMVNTVEELLEVPVDRPDLEDAVVRSAELRLRLVVVGLAQWRSGAATGATALA